MRIFISGGSGLGKTTLTNKLTEVTGLPIKGEVIRSLYNSDKDFFKRPFLVRQSVIFAEYLKLHQSDESFISDRSVLDIGLWTNLNEPSIKIETYLSLIQENDVIVIVPTPSFEHYDNNPGIFFDDPLRFQAYYQLEVFKYMTLEETQNDRSKFLFYVWRLTKELERQFLHYVNMSKATVIYHPANAEDFYSWQTRTIESIKTLKVSNVDQTS